MAYIEPKTDWNESYEPSPSDMNRIEGDIKHIKEENGTIDGNKTFSGNNTHSGDNTFNGATTIYTSTSGKVPFDTLQIFSTPGSGSWTVPSNVYVIKATIIGAGGGGGGVSTDGTSGGNTIFNGTTASGGFNGRRGQTTYNAQSVFNGFVSANHGRGGVDISGQLEDGGGGQVIQEIFNVTPGANLSYTVGAGGTGGLGVVDGSDGGDGKIIIEY